MPSRKTIRLIVMGLIAVGILIGVGVWWLDRSAFVTTDNAYVAAENVSVTPQIEGHVSEVLVVDNQSVEAGQVLVRLDPADARARFDQAQGAAAAANAAVRNVDDRERLEQALILERAASVTSAEAAAERAKLDLDRYGRLADKGWVSDQRLQETRAGALQSSAAVTQAKAALEAEKREAESLGSNRSENLAKAQQALAALDKARIDLERTVIRAPIRGVVGARAVRPGQFVKPGGAMMAIVPLGETYVLANFKETQVARLRIGQAVEVRADAFGKEAIKGRVESFAPATGAEFALIPVENAVGNFTKITQRLPVRIKLDQAGVAGGLRPGLSVRVKVDVKTQVAGPRFAEAFTPPAREVAEQAASPRP